MKTALIAGATGLTGNELIQLLTSNGNYSKIVAIGRRQPLISSNKIYFIKSDFNNLNEVLASTSVDEVYCCLGTTIKKAGSQEAFRRIDLDAVVELGKWAKEHHVSKFAVISSVGANANSSNFYLRTKGQMEVALQNLNLQSLVILRPSILAGNRQEFRLAEKISIALMKAIGLLFIGKMKRYRAVDAKKVATAMIQFRTKEPTSCTIVESEEILNF